MNTIKKNRQKLKELLDALSVTDSKGSTLLLDPAIQKVVSMILEQAKSGRKLIFIGNGGSASLASHMAIDFLKNANIPAMAFNDSSFITCISNDCGFESVFEKPIGILAESGDILLAISSSGQSENILRGAKMAKTKGAKVITLSGFDENNLLRNLGEVNFYAPSKSYGNVEIAHLFLCHLIIDTVMMMQNG